MYRAQNIKDIAEKKKIKIKDLYECTGISRGTLFNLLKEDANPTADNIEKLADFLGCPIDDFFIRNATYQHTNTSGINSPDNKEIELLKQLLEEKERTIQILLKK